MQERKITLITIIILLCIFLPLTAFATTMHFIENKENIENKEHQFYFDGKLYFYNNEDLLGTYVCQNTDYCDYAVSRNTNTYDLIEPKSNGQKYTLLHNRYAILMDTTTMQLLNAPVLLYDVLENQVIGTYKEFKNYGVGIENDYYIASNEDGLWGVLKITDQIEEVIPFTYDYIGLSNIQNKDGQIKSDYFAVLKNNSWSILDSQGNKVSDTVTDSLVDYNETYMITKSGSEMNLLTFDGRNRLFGSYQYLHFCGPYIAIIDATNDFYVYAIDQNKEVSNRHRISSPENISYKVEKEYIHIFDGEELIENIAIS